MIDELDALLNPYRNYNPIEAAELLEKRRVRHLAEVNHKISKNLALLERMTGDPGSQKTARYAELQGQIANDQAYYREMTDLYQRAGIALAQWAQSWRVAQAEHEKQSGEVAEQQIYNELRAAWERAGNPIALFDTVYPSMRDAELARRAWAARAEKLADYAVM